MHPQNYTAFLFDILETVAMASQQEILQEIQTKLASMNLPRMAQGQCINVNVAVQGVTYRVPMIANVREQLDLQAPELGSQAEPQQESSGNRCGSGDNNDRSGMSTGQGSLQKGTNYFRAHLCSCTVGSNASLSVCLSD